MAADGGIIARVARAKRAASSKKAVGDAVRALSDDTRASDPFVSTLLSALADVAEARDVRTIHAATERLKASTATTATVADESALDHVEGRTREAIALADALVVDANKSWRAVKLTPWLERNPGRSAQNRSTRRLLVFLEALDLAAKSGPLTDHARLVRFRLEVMDPACAKRATDALLRESFAAWALKGERKWEHVAVVVKAILGITWDADNMKKAWSRARPKVKDKPRP